MNGTKKELRYVLRGITIIVIGIALAFAAIFAVYVSDWFFRFVWNFVVPDVFGLPELELFQGFAIMILVSILKGDISKIFALVKNKLEEMSFDAFDLIDDLLKIEKETEIKITVNHR